MVCLQYGDSPRSDRVSSRGILTRRRLRGVAWHGDDNPLPSSWRTPSTVQTDRRLPNKEEVLGVLLCDGDARPLAIAPDYAREHPLLHDRVGEHEFVVLTDRSGAMRVYGTDGRRFEAWDGDSRLKDAEGRAWTLHEDRLQLDTVDTVDAVSLPRLPSHSAFWFGWYSAYTYTRLLH